MAICPSFLSKGSCDDRACIKQHTAHLCQSCEVVCTDERALQNHFNGRKHRARLGGHGAPLRCPLCDVHIPGSSAWVQHVSGRKHANVASVRGVSIATVPVAEGSQLPGSTFCAVCNKSIPDGLWSLHASSKLHLRRQRYRALAAAVEEATKDKHGVTVSHPEGFDLGIIALEDAPRGVQGQVTIQNTVPALSVFLISLTFSSASSRLRSRFSTSFSIIAPLQIRYGQNLQIPIFFAHEFCGIYTDRIEFLFEDTRLCQRFAISRALRATIVGDVEEHKRLQPRAPYVPRPRRAREPETNVVPGEAPPAIQAIPYVVKLPQAPIPEHMARIFGNWGARKQVEESLLPRGFTLETYARFWKVLLWAEEYKSEQDLQVYDIDATMLNKHNTFYYLDVPGLAEKRPSVLVGDSIHIQPVHSDPEKGKWFQGCVHVVRRNEVGMKFGHSFHAGYRSDQTYRVRFKLNRYPLRRQHQALDRAFAQARMLFPERSMVSGVAPPNTEGFAASVRNGLIANNAPQLQAVASIVLSPPGSPPFVLFGPPGTGKTVTVVEAIERVLAYNPSARILACAPSNSASDLIASRLSSVLSPDEMFRFYAPSRFKNQVPDDLERYTVTTADGHFSVPPREKLLRFRVIVSTCVSASFAYGIGMACGHFSHMFFDEAGHATEPEIMIAVKTMADNNTNVVLAGDPKQLGPIVRSPIARDLGLEKSFLERLLERETHHVECGHGITVVRLTKNFRSHPSILQFPNEKFYDSALQACGDPSTIESYIGSSILKNKKFPVVFHALPGQDEREANSPSFFNPMEILQVKSYVEQLKSSREVQTTDSDIGVIAPYHLQCQKIRAVLRPIAEGVKVGSVEEFQGQERRVIIISTVRSSRDFVGYDLRHALGFVANPRRLNVAITRAQALLIIVGDPAILSLDPLWRSLLDYIHQNGGWTGEEPTWNLSAEVQEGIDCDMEEHGAGVANMDVYARQMQTATMSAIDVIPEGDDLEETVDRPWRDLE